MSRERALKKIQEVEKIGGSRLNITGEGLDEIPLEITQLKNLEYLYLGNNRITEIPLEITNLRKLSWIDLSNNQLSSVPNDISKLKNLEYLYLKGNNLAALPKDVYKLRKLVWLDLSDNIFSTFPEEILSLAKLSNLNLSSNNISTLPQNFSRLISLEILNFRNNQLESLPLGLFKVSSIRELDFNNNNISRIQSEIFQLKNLNKLDIGKNKLFSLPLDIFQLNNLVLLDISDNQFETIPPEMARLRNHEVHFNNNPLSKLPPELKAQGKGAIFRYLREQLNSRKRQWISKLLVVGEGGVGKTSLLRALRGEEFNTQQLTTHGIETNQLEMVHPSRSGVVMQLNTWDFGGQEIYHATHQFFLTNRSLFLIVWNARHGFEQGKLYYWLKTIRANAPESPILLVATWIDERDAALPLNDIKSQFPQIIGQCEVSNKTQLGIDDLKKTIAEAAAALPLMGERWPSAWLNFAKFVRSHRAKYATPKKFWQAMNKFGVGHDSYSVLARWLHELGDILFFLDNPELRNLVILKPEWVTGYISRVLESEDVISKKGIFTRHCMDEIWDDLNPTLKQHFLRLMEKFDLSYRIPDVERDISLIVERLPYEIPLYQEYWERAKQQPNCKEISMRFQLSEVLPGIPTWFIARQHRFSMGLHWRTGVLLAYGNERTDLGLVRTGRDDKTNAEYLELKVRGILPVSFFDLLKEGIEVTLRRYPGLDITRLLPCPDPLDVQCKHEFDYGDLFNRLKLVPPKKTIECPKCLEYIPVTQLLFGLHPTTEEAVFSRLEKLDRSVKNGFESTMQGFQDLRELTQRNFVRQFRSAQQFPESYCPSVFVIRPEDPNLWGKISSIDRLASETVNVQLYCQYPGQWHPTEQGGTYEVDNPAQWLVTVSPYIHRLVNILKYASPLISPILGYMVPELEKAIKSDIGLMNELIKKLPEGKNSTAESSTDYEYSSNYELQNASGFSLRSFRQFLEAKDPKQHWGGLRRVLTPEGDYLWLCEKHAQEYASSYSRNLTSISPIQTRAD